MGLIRAVLILMSSAVVAAADWPQFLGPARNGASTETVSEQWPKDGPRILWTKRVGQGLSGPVVAAGRTVVFHRIQSEEVVESFDAVTGATQWRHAYPTRYRDDFGFDEGPRAVPVVAGGLVYTYGAEGKLHAIDLTSGKERWAVDAVRQFEVPKGFFGAAGSPLVDATRVIANIGGAKGGIVAFDAATGKVLWTSTNHGASYSSGVAATIHGARYAIFLTREGLVGLNPATGQVRFERPWRARQAASVNAATPLVIGDAIFVSAEYGPGAGLLRVNGAALTELWLSNDVLSNHYATSVYRDGVLYGFHGRQEFGQVVRAIDAASGKVLWSTGRVGAGTVTLAGGRLLLLFETGELVLAEASRAAYRPLASSRILAPTVRAYPALSNGVLYARNGDTLVAVDLR